MREKGKERDFKKVNNQTPYDFEWTLLSLPLTNNHNPLTWFCGFHGSSCGLSSLHLFSFAFAFLIRLVPAMRLVEHIFRLRPQVYRCSCQPLFANTILVLDYWRIAGLRCLAVRWKGTVGNKKKKDYEG